MKRFTIGLFFGLCLFLMAACSGEEDKAPVQPPKAEKEVATPYDAQIGALKEAQALSKDFENKEKAREDMVNQMLDQ